jgi:hypothetical protein
MDHFQNMGAQMVREVASTDERSGRPTHDDRQLSLRIHFRTVSKRDRGANPEALKRRDQRQVAR